VIAARAHAEARSVAFQRCLGTNGYFAIFASTKTKATSKTTDATKGPMTPPLDQPTILPVVRE
jgi:hypothetical protein